MVETSPFGSRCLLTYHVTIHYLAPMQLNLKTLVRWIIAEENIITHILFNNIMKPN